MYGRPVAVVPTWKIVTMCGCPDNLPIATCSRTNRSRLSGSRSEVSTFTATVRSSWGWLQRYTTPNPPRPISSGPSKPAATNSAGTPACISPCVGRGSLLAIACLDLQRRHGGTMATQPEHKPNGHPPMADDQASAGRLEPVACDTKGSLCNKLVGVLLAIPFARSGTGDAMVDRFLL